MRRLAREQSGFSLVEMMMAVALLGAVVAVFGPILTSSMNSARVTQNESRALDEIRVAVARIDRELRSAQCIAAPASGQSGSSLSFTTLAGTGGAYDVTYGVDAEGKLTRTVDGDTTPVGEGIVVTSEEFTHASNPGQRASVAIDLQVRFEETNTPRRITTEIAGRDTWEACP